MEVRMKQINTLKATAIFLVSTVYFYILLFTLLPFIKANLDLNPAMYWFITGYFLFVPLFIAAVVFARKDGNKTAKEVLCSLNVRPMTKNEWGYALTGTLSVFVLTGLIFAVSVLLNKNFGVRELSTTPWFMTISPFRGSDRLLLLVWLPMFAFNILGEELLWRGYIQTRLKNRFSWVLCAFLWLLFHLPFGMDLMIMLLPVVLILPYAFHKTQNTCVGIFIHGVYNGPIFVLVALGLMH